MSASAKEEWVLLEYKSSEDTVPHRIAVFENEADLENDAIKRTNKLDCKDYLYICPSWSTVFVPYYVKRKVLVGQESAEATTESRAAHQQWKAHVASIQYTHRSQCRRCSAFHTHSSK